MIELGEKIERLIDDTNTHLSIERCHGLNQIILVKKNVGWDEITFNSVMNVFNKSVMENA